MSTNKRVSFHTAMRGDPVWVRVGEQFVAAHVVSFSRNRVWVMPLDGKRICTTFDAILRRDPNLIEPRPRKAAELRSRLQGGDAA